ncbi:WD repeat-containing protein 91 [Galendromus occidentalis]|uniref:WD repeat-containing protein 91 n=1 Tax=Galendromus occidentalis TaxID=34638 RepID=A0AAJ6VZG8_9ACAR|nr:WD repeat-containing protein 91 [Galendromus occidentalis]
MASAIQYVDELVRDYLLYRGFVATLKSFEVDQKNDKTRALRPDKIVENMASCIDAGDLEALRDTWHHLDNQIFRRLEHSYQNPVRKMEFGVYRLYLVTCISTGKLDKVSDFFEKMTPEIQGQPEWKEWFVLPFIKAPEENPVFQLYFTRHWQESLMVSLRNLLSVVFQNAPLPTLLQYEEDANRIKELAEENEQLKKQLSALRGDESQRKTEFSPDHALRAPDELIDDFYVIAQSSQNK